MRRVVVLALASLAGAASAQTTPVPPAASPAPPPREAAAEPIAAILRAPDHAVLARLVQAAGLETILATPGALTLFAPDDAAFGRLAPGTLERLLLPENRANLVRFLTFHLLPESVDAGQLTARAGAASVRLRTLAGPPLLASMESGAIRLTDGNANRSYVTVPDQRRSNGIVHRVNGVLVPPFD